MAVGGQGAPLVPYLDRILLRGHFVKKERVGMLLNVGGISNISAFVPPPSLNTDNSNNKDGRFVGFDCGPGMQVFVYHYSSELTISCLSSGNVLMDSLMKRWFGEDFDRDGKNASEGRVSEQLLERLMKEDQFIRSPPPKSTGREVNAFKQLRGDNNLRCQSLTPFLPTVLQ